MHLIRISSALVESAAAITIVMILITLLTLCVTAARIRIPHIPPIMPAKSV